MRALLLLALLAAPAMAQPGQPGRLIPPFYDRGTITLRNATDQTLRQLFLWNQFLPGEGEDRLEGQALPPGSTRPLELGMGHCHISLRAVFVDGSEARVRLLEACNSRELVLEAPPTPGAEPARMVPR